MLWACRTVVSDITTGRVTPETDPAQHKAAPHAAVQLHPQPRAPTCLFTIGDACWLHVVCCHAMQWRLHWLGRLHSFLAAGRLLSYQDVLKGTAPYTVLPGTCSAMQPYLSNPVYTTESMKQGCRVMRCYLPGLCTVARVNQPGTGRAFHTRLTETCAAGAQDRSYAAPSYAGGEPVHCMCQPGRRSRLTGRYCEVRTAVQPWALSYVAKPAFSASKIGTTAVLTTIFIRQDYIAAYQPMFV